MSLDSVSDDTGADSKWTPVIEQHANWLAVNPVQGCPKGCSYCFLRPRGLTRVAPVELMAPEEARDCLLSSPLYDPGVPLALYTHTDAFSTLKTRRHLRKLLTLLSESGISNPVILMSKCAVSSAVLETLTDFQEAGGRLVVYLSYSGLGPAVELGVRHASLQRNFSILADAQIPVVHYWRPIIPANAEFEIVARVFRLASTFAKCSLISGLKYPIGGADVVSEVWPEIAFRRDARIASAIYPRVFHQNLLKVAREACNYPLYESNACALSYALGAPNLLGIYSTSSCVTANCPSEQRSICRRAHSASRPVDSNSIHRVLARLDLAGMIYRISDSGEAIEFRDPLSTATLSRIRYLTGLRVRAPRHPKDTYWRSSIGDDASDVIVD